MHPLPLETIILVDDSMIDNMFHARVIKRSRLAREVLTFSMAEDALAYLRMPVARKADLILLDINMPRMDGFEMLEAAITEFGAMALPPVVMMLGAAPDPRTERRARDLPVIKDSILKPLTAARFSDLVASIRPDRAA